MASFNGLNYLTSNRATLQILGMQDAEFAVTSFNIPSVTLQFSNVPTPFLAGKEVTSKPDFGEISISFIVDEEMKNWLAIYEWMMDLSFRKSIKPRFVDGTITIYSSHNNPIIKFNLSEIAPIYLSDISFSESSSETSPITATARFALTLFSVTKM
jgi:hypothetical protein